MNYDSVTGLPLKESFLTFVNQFLKREENDRFAFLAVRLHAGLATDTLTIAPQRNFLLTGIVQKFIRKQDYILSAYRQEADTFIAFIDTSILLQRSLEDALLEAFGVYTQYVTVSFPTSSLTLQGGICRFHDFEQPTVCIQHAIDALTMLSTQKQQKQLLFYEQAIEQYQNVEQHILPLFEDVWSNNHIFIHLQPKMNIETKQLNGAQALVRVTDAKGKILKPASFLPVLEKNHLTYELDLMVAERILILLQHWIQEDITPYPISINISEQTFYSPVFHKVFHELMEKYHTAFRYLLLELQTGILKTKDTSILHALHELHRQGCQILMEDINETPNIQSINQGLIDGVICNRQTLLNAMHDQTCFEKLKEATRFYHDCNISVICKGIESQDEEQYAKQFHMQTVQGFYYGRPIPFDIFQKKYLNHIFIHNT